MTASGRLVILLTMVGWLLAAAVTAGAYTVPAHLAPLSPPEKRVLEKVERGVAEKFAPDEPRTLRAGFIAALLTHGFPGLSIPYQGVRIANASIGDAQHQDELNLENAVVKLPVILDNCVFHGRVNLKFAHFQQTLDLGGSTFKQGVNAWHTQADQDLMLGWAHFQGLASFRWAKIKGNFFARGADFQDAEKFDGNSIQVGGSLFFREAKFQVPLDLVGANIGMNLEGDNVKFLAPKGEISFNGLAAGQNILLRQAEFRGPVDLRSVRVGESLDLSGARGGAYLVNCNGARIRNNIRVADADFAGPVDFSAAQIGYNFEANGVHFKSNSQVTFNSLQVGHSFFLGVSKPANRRPSFGGPASFAFIIVTNNFFLNNADFQDRVEFPRAVIGNDFRVARTKFQGAKPVSFNSMQAGYAYFQDNSFLADVDLANGIFTDLTIATAPPSEASQTDPTSESLIDRLTLSGVRVKRNLTLSQLNMQRLQADFLEVKGAATFRNLSFQSQVDLTFAAFQTLRLLRPNWPPRRDQVSNVWLDRATYATITAKDELFTKPELINEDHRQLLQWFESFQFNIENYVQLENYARRAGYGGWADEVYIAGKQREWRQERFSFWKYLTLIFWDWGAGFGRKPQRVVAVALFFVVLGAFLFDPAYVEAQSLQNWGWAREILEMKTKREVLKNCLYWFFIRPDRHKIYLMTVKYFLGVKMGLSLDVFIPTHHPVLVHHWDRYAIPYGMRIYYYIHRGMGMILVPLAAAAFLIQFHISP